MTEIGRIAGAASFLSLMLLALPFSSGHPARADTESAATTVGNSNWAPDGPRLAYECLLGDEQQICIIDLDSNNAAPRTITALPARSPFIVVLGIAQDGGSPQAGTKDDPGWDDPALRRRVASLGLVDPPSGGRWMFDATPDFREQLHHLDRVAPVAGIPGLAGIFLTHAHIGHS